MPHQAGHGGQVLSEWTDAIEGGSAFVRGVTSVGAAATRPHTQLFSNLLGLNPFFVFRVRARVSANADIVVGAATAILTTLDGVGWNIRDSLFNGGGEIRRQAVAGGLVTEVFRRVALADEWYVLIEDFGWRVNNSQGLEVEASIVNVTISVVYEWAETGANFGFP